MEKISKQEARKLGQPWYFTGIPCKNGHVDKRYSNTGICYSCKRENMAKDYEKNKERIAECNKKSYSKNKEKRNKTSLEWAKKNREKSNEIKKKSKLKHKEKTKSSAREYQKRKRKDNSFRLSKNLSKAIWECLKGKKSNKNWEDFVSFTLQDLKLHLEERFKESMTWDNYGSFWHLDHIKPLSWFNLETEFEKAWSLNNLQPLEAKLNLSKNNKYEG